jgi:hypothetical protein
MRKLFDILLFIVLMPYLIAKSSYYEVIVGPYVARKLGFGLREEYISVGQRLHSALAIGSIIPDGVFDRAGFRVGDVLPGMGYDDLFGLLQRCRGRVAELTVVDGGQGPPFWERPHRVIRFDVPLR